MNSAGKMVFGALVACWCALGAAAERPNAVVTIDIEQQPLRQALTAFARQTGLQVMMREEDVEAGRETARTVKGELSPQEALEQLLESTNLKYEFVTQRMVRISAQERRARAVAQRGSRGGIQIAQSNQAAGPNPSDGASASEDGADPAGNQRPEAPEAITEVVVTAQKRAESLQKVPISISVLGGAQLDKSTVEGVTEALSLVPGVITAVGYSGGGAQVAVRGVAAAAPFNFGASPIAYYLDSIPFGLTNAAIAPDSNGYDLERVEVLRGPQGTLYGSSALNGVVRVLTRDADLEQFELKARTALSTTKGGGENSRIDAAVNVPLIEGKLAARAVVGYQDLSGWIDRPNREDANEGEITNLRFKINAQPTDALSIAASAWLSRSDYDNPAMSLDNGRHTSLHSEPVKVDYDAYGLKVGYDLSGFTLTSMTSYLDFSSNSSLDMVPFIGLDVPFINGFPDATAFSEEVILNSTHDGAWRWSLGGIYRDAKDRRVALIPTLTAQDDTLQSESFAVYGEITRLFSDGALELTGGLRYFEDEIQLRDRVTFVQSSGKFDALTPRVVLTWYPSEQMTTYLSYSEGFRSGVLQAPLSLTVAPDLPPADADSLKNYEVGAKGSLWDGRVGFDTAVYYIDWQDVQSSITLLYQNIPLSALANGESASGVGFDIGVTTQPFDGLTFGANFSWNDLKWDSDVLSGGSVLFMEGERLSLSSEYTAGISADYAFPFGRGDLQGRISASGNYNSALLYHTGIGRTLGDPIFNARAQFAVEFPGRWTATLFADNINNERGAVIVPPFNTPDWTTRVRPRTIGVQLEFHL